MIRIKAIAQTLSAHVRLMRAAYWVLFIALVSTGILYVLLCHQLDWREQGRFREASESVLNAVDLHLRSDVGLLEAIRGLYLANPSMSQQQWNNFFKSFQLREAFPGLRSVGLIVRVPAAEKKKHIAAMRQKLAPNYRVFPETEQKEYFPLIYFQPAEEDAKLDVIGCDAGSDLAHRHALDKARETGLPISTGKIPLSTGSSNHARDGFTVYLPIYTGEETPSSMEERNTTLRGFVVATYVPEKLWSGLTSYAGHALLDVEIFEGDEMNEQTLLFDNDTIPHRAHKSRYSGSLQMSVFGHRWTMFFSTLPGFEMDSKRLVARLAPLIGCTISMLLFGIAWTQVKSRIASEHLSAELRRSEETLRKTNEQLQLKVLESNQAHRELAVAHHLAQAEQEQLSVTLRSIGEAVLTTDTEGRVRLMNQAAEVLTGRTAAEALGQELARVFELRQRQSQDVIPSGLEEALEKGRSRTSAKDSVLVSKDGLQKSVSVTAAPIRATGGNIVGAVLVARDITDQERLEAELLLARKLESVGILAGGLAHDFNTLLTGILGNVCVARLMASTDQQLEERLAHAEKSCLRAKELTERLLTFAQNGPPTSRPAPITQLLNDTAQLAVRGSACRCTFLHPEDLWPVQIDEAQICQVVYDLVANGVQAMSGRGTIHLTSQNVTLPFNRALPLPEGNYVQINVRDEGAGIAPEHLSRIFDPYFTTKQQGSGLGLATAYFVLQRHHGLILADSRLGHGTTFRLYLPAAAAVLPANAEPLPSLPGIQGRILLMDDDPLILNLGAVVLQRLGYEVSLAKDGEEALQRFYEARALGQSFSVAILDLNIQGGMGGTETMKRLASLDPQLKGVVASGYLQDPVMTHCKDHGFMAAITKPYHGSELAKVLSRILRVGTVL